MTLNYKEIFLGFIAVALLLSGSLLSAQDSDGRRDKHGPEFRYDPAHQARAQEMMESLRVWKVTEILEVDEKLAEKLYPRIREQGKIRRESDEMLLEGIRNLQRLLDQNPLDEKALNEAMDGYMALKVQRAVIDQKAMNRILELLTVKQRAQYLVIDEEFPKMVRKFLKQRGRGMEPDSGRSPRRQRPGNTPGTR